MFKATGHLGRDADSREARMGQEVNPYNILIDEIFGETWGELGGNLWQGAKNVGGFGKELGGGAVGLRLVILAGSYCRYTRHAE